MNWTPSYATWLTASFVIEHVQENEPWSSTIVADLRNVTKNEERELQQTVALPSSRVYGIAKRALLLSALA
jgi:hypothetical protein